MNLLVKDMNPTDAEAAVNRRGHRRVGVCLRVAIMIDRESACIAHTVDLSEGGMLVCEYSGPGLLRGRLVGVSLRGVLSDSDAADNDQYLMRVVRHRGDQLALRFSEDH